MNAKTTGLKVMVLVLLLSCKKTTIQSESSAFNIVNAVNNSNPLVTGFVALGSKGNAQQSLQYFATANQIPFGSAYESGSYSGATSLSISQISDTLLSLWNGNFDFAVGSIHTLFFCGDTTAVDTLLTTDIIPYYPVGDSVAGVRFVNLSQNSLPMTVNIQGQAPSQYEFSNLSYKGISAFKGYTANSANPGPYVFEIRDQATGNLLSTYSWTVSFQKTNTVIICGSVVVGYTVFQMNNY